MTIRPQLIADSNASTPAPIFASRRSVVLQLAFIAALLVAGVGCGGVTVAAENQGSAQISLQNITCSSCVSGAAKAVRKVPGVMKVALVVKTAELVIRYDRTRTSPAALAKTIEAAGYQAVVGAGKGNYKAHVVFTKAMDVKQYNEPPPSLDIRSLPVAGKVTVVDYGAAWCGPCRKVDREMYTQLLKHKTLALRRLDIGDWSSAFAKKHLAKVSTLPFILVFDANKKQIARIEGLDLPKLRQAIATGVAAIAK